MSVNENGDQAETRRDAELFVQHLEEFIIAVIMDHGSIHVEDSVRKIEVRKQLVQYLAPGV